MNKLYKNFVFVCNGIYENIQFVASTKPYSVK